MKRWNWWCPSQGFERDEDRRRVEGWDGRAAAEAAAKYFYLRCDGWECSWPVGFYVAPIEDNGDEGPPSFFSVDVDMCPVFSASPAKETP